MILEFKRAVKFSGNCKEEFSFDEWGHGKSPRPAPSHRSLGYRRSLIHTIKATSKNEKQIPWHARLAISRNFECVTPGVMLSLCSSFVRPYSKECSDAPGKWCPHWGVGLAKNDSLRWRRNNNEAIWYRSSSTWTGCLSLCLSELQTNWRTRSNGQPSPTRWCSTDICSSSFTNNKVQSARWFT